jgi:hypothetical protein
MVAISQVMWALLREEIMKKTLIVIGFVACLLPVLLHAGTELDLKGVYHPATVISVKKLVTTVNYAYEVTIRVDCTLYVARYKSSTDVAPIAVPIDDAVHPVNALVDGHGHWIRVAFSPDHIAELRLISATPLDGKSCVADSAAASATIPAGTILPVRLDSTIRSDQSRPGTSISATLMQDVPLGTGMILHAGSKVTGHVMETIDPGTGSDEARVSFQFDQVRLGNQIVPITTNLRALASADRVLDVHLEEATGDKLIQIGGDQVSYGGTVMVGSEIVGKRTRQGVLAYVNQDIGSECRNTVDGNTRPQAFWVFSVDACGTYGFGGVKILHFGRTEPVGQVTLISVGKTLKVGKSSGMLLRVDRSGPDETRAQINSLPGSAQSTLELP